MTFTSKASPWFHLFQPWQKPGLNSPPKLPLPWVYKQRRGKGRGKLIKPLLWELGYKLILRVALCRTRRWTSVILGGPFQLRNTKF